MIRPNGPLMVEHRLIEKLVELLKKEALRMKKDKNLDPDFISASVDFFRFYADNTHHGKEEDILFRECARKSLSDDLKKVMVGLLDDHVFARAKVGALLECKDRFVNGDKNAFKDAISIINDLVALYPVHIIKEDKEFFPAVLKYFSDDEQDRMTKEFFEFDRSMIHSKYKSVVEGLSKD
jgi:hemerythrin-like domain-containing protein